MKRCTRDNITVEMYTIQCLDFGYVKLVDWMPRNIEPELRIAQAARISFNQDDREGDYRNLVRYLYTNYHTSPLEMVEFMFEIKCPQFVATHFHRHRTANINEQSQRYTEISDEFYHISTDIRRQSKTNKQGSVEDNELAQRMLGACQQTEDLITNQLLPAYHDLVRNGVAKEVARAYLPRSSYTRMIYKMDANNLLKLLQLRCAPDAQKETRIYANAMKELVKHLIPTLIACLDERLQSITLNPEEIACISQGILKLPNDSKRKQELYAGKFHRLRRKKLVVLVGYKRTGKDTLADDLINGRDISGRWWFTYPLPKLVNVRRVALADKVKENVHNMVADLHPDYNNKDGKQACLGNRSLRDLYIEYSMKKRETEPDIWLQYVLDIIAKDQEHDIIITDCRFNNEMLAFVQVPDREVITIRLFRSCVPIPENNDIAEHDLDLVKTDYLLTDSLSSLAKALELFPQYQ